jgi:small-conductance mechanosensitive channel
MPCASIGRRGTSASEAGSRATVPIIMRYPRMTDAAKLLFSLFPGSTPAWLVVLLVLLVAFAMAWLVHAAAHLIACRFFGRRDNVHAILKRTKGLTRFALLILVVSALLPLAPISAQVQDEVHRILLAAFIVLAGWVAIVSVNIALERYVRDFRVDVADNLMARKAVTQVQVLKRALDVLLIFLTAGFALMSFDSVRQFGVSLFASAGVAGIAAGLAARPVLGNLIAGMQIAITQPIRLGDVLVIQGNWGVVEEISSTYVVLKIWDWRRLIIPLSYFFDNPFENWTRSSAALIGSVMLYVDYTVPVDAVRVRLQEIAKASPLWDGQVINLQVTDARQETIELRALVSARDSGTAFDLRCEVREKLLAFLRSEYPGALPRRRTEAFVESAASNGRAAQPNAH